MKLNFLSLIPFLLTGQSWTPLTTSPGVGLAEIQFTGSDKSPVTLTVARAAPSRVLVVDTLAAVKGKVSYPAYSLEEILRLTPGAVAALTGGNSNSFSFPMPLGLLKVNGREISRMRRSKSPGAIFCLGPSGARIIAIADYQTAACPHAIQSWPRLLESRRAVVSGKDAYARAAIGVHSSGDVYLVYSTPTSLADFASFLLKLGLTDAINLPGDSTAGLVARTPKATRHFGSTTVLVASAIVLR